MEPSYCPACFAVLPASLPSDEHVKCPRCYHVLTPADAQTQTGAQTPYAKRKSTPPSSE